jgi:hypothetical protein
VSGKSVLQKAGCWPLLLSFFFSQCEVKTAFTKPSQCHKKSIHNAIDDKGCDSSQVNEVTDTDTTTGVSNINNNTVNPVKKHDCKAYADDNDSKDTTLNADADADVVESISICFTSNNVFCSLL